VNSGISSETQQEQNATKLGLIMAAQELCGDDKGVVARTITIQVAAEKANSWRQPAKNENEKRIPDQTSLLINEPCDIRASAQATFK
jgi:hypothetical protein